MRARVILFVAVLVMGVIGGPAASVAAADVTLTVSVRTAAGASVGGADLTASWDGGSTTATTASNGKAFLDVPEGADVTIEVDHSIYVRNEPYEVTDASEQEVEVTVWEKASASIRVVDRNGPVENTRVIFRKSGNIVAVRSTNVQGRVDSGVIESGDYTVSLRKPGYFRKTVPLQVQGDVEEELSIERGSVSVEFQVLDDNFDPQQPVADAQISGPDFSGSSYDDGTRAFSVPVNSELTVTVEKEGYDTVERTVVVREQDLQINVSTRKLPQVNVDLTNERIVVGESVQVTVTNEYDEPLPEATVYLNGEEVGQPNSQGVLRVPIESTGEHTLFAQYEQRSSEQLTVAGVTSEGATVVEVVNTDGPDQAAVQPAGFFAVPGAGSIHLRSVGFGVALGLVIAAFLFVYFRVG